MFDIELAKKQIGLLPNEELRRIYSLRAEGEYVPGYYELVALELKKRGVDGCSDAQMLGGAAKDKELRGVGADGKKGGEYLHIVDEYSRMFANNEIKNKLGIANLSSEELIQMYIWESETSHLMGLISEELKGRLIDPDNYVPPRIVDMPSMEHEPGQKECPKCSVSVRTTDNYCFSCGKVLV